MAGLVGGVASGKSTVAGMFRELGAEVLDADRLGHQALDDPGIRKRVVEAFGRGVLGNGAKVDRRRLGALAFRSRAELRRLEAIVHPWILARMERTLERWARRPVPPPLAVLDVVLLLESGADELCDRILYVKTNARARSQRAGRERRWAKGEVARREGHQRSLAAKARLADEVIDNGGPLERTRAQVEAIFHRLTQSGGPHAGTQARP